MNLFNNQTFFSYQRLASLNICFNKNTVDTNNLVTVGNTLRLDTSDNQIEVNSENTDGRECAWSEEESKAWKAAERTENKNLSIFSFAQSLSGLFKMLKMSWEEVPILRQVAMLICPH